ncbi:MAG: ion transporter [Bacteroidia bacterium]|nr:ion transporter [Bacteroidia bacterium]
MSTPKKDENNMLVGFDSVAGNKRQRSLNSDGSYNIRRLNMHSHDKYRWLINCSWSHYWLVMLSYYILANAFFGLIYFIIGAEHLHGISDPGALGQYIKCFFFSVQSFTTVGYGGIYPIGFIASSVAGIEAFVGLMTLAVATGSLYGRFSRPLSKLKYSSNAIIAPFQEGKALMFMMANNRENNLIEVEAYVNYSYSVEENGKKIRKFTRLSLESEKISMLAMNWTIVHPIDESSHFYGLTMDDILEEEGEMFILMKAFDDTYGQTVHSRTSYTAEEFIWGAKFLRPFYSDANGTTVIDLDKIGDFEKVELNNYSNTKAQKATQTSN